MDTMEMRRDADRAVQRGIVWLDANVPKWRERIDVNKLNLQYPCECVLGQLDDDFYKSVWNRRLERAEVLNLGFAAGAGMRYATLTAAWKRALKAIAEAAWPSAS